MELLIALCALGVERYLNISNSFQRFTWFPKYVDFLYRNLKPKGVWKDYLGYLCIVIPILLIVAIVFYSLKGLLNGLAEFILGFMILLYCFGPKDFYQTVENKILKHTENDKDDVIVGEEANELSTDDQKISAGMFVEFNRRVFAVFFWFVILGPLGAVFYRINQLILIQIQKGNAEFSEMKTTAVLVADILDWIPVRLLGVGFAFLGHFAKVFHYWIKNILLGLSKNYEFLVVSGFLALDGDPKKHDLETHKSILELLDRVMIFYLVILAILTLGAFIY